MSRGERWNTESRGVTARLWRSSQHVTASGSLSRCSAMVHSCTTLLFIGWLLLKRPSQIPSLLQSSSSPPGLSASQLFRNVLARTPSIALNNSFVVLGDRCVLEELRRLGRSHSDTLAAACNLAIARLAHLLKAWFFMWLKCYLCEPQDCSLCICSNFDRNVRTFHLVYLEIVWVIHIETFESTWFGHYCPWKFCQGYHF